MFAFFSILIRRGSEIVHFIMKWITGFTYSFAPGLCWLFILCHNIDQRVYYHHIDPKHYWSDADLVGQAKVGLCAGGLGKVCERQKVGDKNSCSFRGLPLQGSFWVPWLRASHDIASEVRDKCCVFYLLEAQIQKNFFGVLEAIWSTPDTWTVLTIF